MRIALALCLLASVCTAQVVRLPDTNRRAVLFFDDAFRNYGYGGTPSIVGAAGSHSFVPSPTGTGLKITAASTSSGRYMNLGSDAGYYPAAPFVLSGSVWIRLDAPYIGVTYILAAWEGESQRYAATITTNAVAFRYVDGANNSSVYVAPVSVDLGRWYFVAFRFVPSRTNTATAVWVNGVTLGGSWSGTSADGYRNVTPAVKVGSLNINNFGYSNFSIDNLLVQINPIAEQTLLAPFTSRRRNYSQ